MQKVLGVEKKKLEKHDRKMFDDFTGYGVT